MLLSVRDWGKTVLESANCSLQACFPVFSTVCLELAATNSSDQRLCPFLNPDRSSLLFTHAFTEKWSDQRLWSYDHMAL